MAAVCGAKESESCLLASGIEPLACHRSYGGSRFERDATQLRTLRPACGLKEYYRLSQ